MRRRPEFQTPLPGPRAIDPRSGFEIPHSELTKEYHGNLVARRFADKPHPLDFPPPRISERATLPNAAPEPEEVGIAIALTWEDGFTPIITEDGSAVLSEGVVPTL